MPSDGGRLFLSGYIKLGLIHTLLLLKAKLEFQYEYIKQWNPPPNNQKYYTLSYRERELSHWSRDGDNLTFITCWEI